MADPLERMRGYLSRVLPERRVFLRSQTETRFIRLTPSTQAIALAGSMLVVGWAIVATAVIVLDTIGSGNAREQAKRERALYERLLNDLSAERDLRADEAARAQARFSQALDEVSHMQTTLLHSEDRRKELETGIEVVQDTLRATIRARDKARAEMAALSARLEGVGTDDDPALRIADYETTLDTLSGVLADLSAERDSATEAASEAAHDRDALLHEARLTAERNDRIFAQLEDAVSISLAPLDNMFRKVGLPTDKVLATIRKGYSGRGGPLTPITFSTKGNISDIERKANSFLERLDELSVYRLAIAKAPVAMPLKTAFRYSSGFGGRWGRAHEGIDMAGAYGSPIYATADGVVTHAGWSSGYGNLVKIQHDFGLETRYGHMSKVRVSVGQRVSRGDRIGDMGSTGRSTGNHLHYEVRVGGAAVNPVTYLKAGQDVF